MAKKHRSERNWTQVEGEAPGVEYEESGGYVSVRVPDGDWYKTIGPIRLVGHDTMATVRQLLVEFRLAKNSN